MKSLALMLLVILGALTVFAGSPAVSAIQETGELESITGIWVRMSPIGPISLNFKQDGTVEGDLGKDNTVDIVSEFKIEKGSISFRDKKGVTCPGTGVYQVSKTDYYLSFDLLEDNCGGRIKSTMGIWVRQDWEDGIKELTGKLKASSDPWLYLQRARIYIAVGKSNEARQDLDKYIQNDPSDARVFLNRAGTRFPADMSGAVMDCNTAISLDPENKNAYFLRGLANYELGNKDQGCKDFYKAIELGFTVLKEAEYQRCSEYWKSIKNQ